VSRPNRTCCQATDFLSRPAPTITPRAPAVVKCFFIARSASHTLAIKFAAVGRFFFYGSCVRVLVGLPTSDSCHNATSFHRGEKGQEEPHQFVLQSYSLERLSPTIRSQRSASDSVYRPSHLVAHQTLCLYSPTQQMSPYPVVLFRAY
jgi:hypothetical protein